MLTVVNPHVRFAPCQGMLLIKGMAVSLNRFLKILEMHGIEHPEEKIIHQQLSPRQDATTCSKSFFQICAFGRLIEVQMLVTGLYH